MGTIDINVMQDGFNMLSIISLVFVEILLGLMVTTDMKVISLVNPGTLDTYMLFDLKRIKA